MKQDKIKPCLVCGEGIMHNGSLMFISVEIQRYIVDLRAVQHQHGLEMMLGGHAPLANILGPNEDIAKGIEEPVKGLLCLDCAMKTVVFHALERGEESNDKDRRAKSTS